MISKDQGEQPEQGSDTLQMFSTDQRQQPQEVSQGEEPQAQGDEPQEEAPRAHPQVRAGGHKVGVALELEQ